VAGWIGEACAYGGVRVETPIEHGHPLGPDLLTCADGSSAEATSLQLFGNHAESLAPHQAAVLALMWSAPARMSHLAACEPASFIEKGNDTVRGMRDAGTISPAQAQTSLAAQLEIRTSVSCVPTPNPSLQRTALNSYAVRRRPNRSWLLQCTQRAGPGHF